jgi:hypothetical protein
MLMVRSSPLSGVGQTLWLRSTRGHSGESLVDVDVARVHRDLRTDCKRERHHVEEFAATDSDVASCLRIEGAGARGGWLKLVMI